MNKRGVLNQREGWKIGIMQIKGESGINGKLIKFIRSKYQESLEQLGLEGRVKWKKTVFSSHVYFLNKSLLFPRYTVKKRELPKR